MRSRALAVLLTVVAVTRVEAQSRGSGGNSATAATAPATKSAGPAEERAQLPGRDGPAEPRHGILGAPGAAPDANGPTRLGASALTAPISAGERSGGASTWQSGDGVRSATSADVRQARQQQAPDLEYVGGNGAKPAEDQQGKGKR
jgi:hypothetical protein